MKRFGIFARVTMLFLVICGFCANTKADTHGLDFNPYAFTTEFFRENGNLRGSCGAAAVVIVENHLNLGYQIPSDAVKLKNSQMLADPIVSMRPTYDGRKFYISYISGISKRLERDGYRVNQLGTTNRQTAINNIYDALARKHWVIVVAIYGFATKNTGHFYPIYGGNLIKVNGVVNENTSKLNAIDDLYANKETYNINNPIWSDMYKSSQNGNAPTLKQALISMKAASDSSIYNIIEVYK